MNGLSKMNKAKIKNREYLWNAMCVEMYGQQMIIGISAPNVGERTLSLLEDSYFENAAS